MKRIRLNTFFGNQKTPVTHGGRNWRCAKPLPAAVHIEKARMSKMHHGVVDRPWRNQGGPCAEPVMYTGKMTKKHREIAQRYLATESPIARRVRREKLHAEARANWGKPQMTMPEIQTAIAAWEARGQ